MNSHNGNEYFSSVTRDLLQQLVKENEHQETTMAKWSVDITGKARAVESRLSHTVTEIPGLCAKSKTKYIFLEESPWPAQGGLVLIILIIKE